MLKRSRHIESSKTLDKKNTSRKRERNSKFHSIDNVPNDNLYKNDNFYSINKNFEFFPNEEQSFRTFFHYQFQRDGIN